MGDTRDRIQRSGTLFDEYGVSLIHRSVEAGVGDMTGVSPAGYYARYSRSESPRNTDSRKEWRTGRPNGIAVPGSKSENCRGPPCLDARLEAGHASESHEQQEPV